MENTEKYHKGFRPQGLPASEPLNPEAVAERLLAMADSIGNLYGRCQQSGWTNRTRVRRALTAAPLNSLREILTNESGLCCCGLPSPASPYPRPSRLPARSQRTPERHAFRFQRSSTCQRRKGAPFVAEAPSETLSEPRCRLRFRPRRFAADAPTGGVQRAPSEESSCRIARASRSGPQRSPSPHVLLPRIPGGAKNCGCCAGSYPAHPQYAPAGLRACWPPGGMALLRPFYGPPFHSGVCWRHIINC